MTTVSPSVRYVPELDAIRGIAILGVVAYHVDPFLVPFGSGGVSVFFVLSGFLITKLILQERERTGRFDYRAFYLRRAVRLFPALLLTVVGAALLMLLLRDPNLASYWPQALVSLLYVGDVAQPLGFAMPHLGHTWSLAVEEQFYLVWPALLLVLVHRLRHRRGMLVGAILALTVASFAWRLIVAGTSTDPVRLYFAPDVNLAPLLLGSLLAVVPLPKAPRWPAYVALGALGGVFILPMFSTTLTGWRMEVWMGTVSSLLAAVLLWSAPVAGGLFRLAPLIWIGRISYGWYLWHQVIWALQPLGHPLQGVPMHAMAAVIGLGFAVLSFYFVERPLSRRLRPLIARASGARTVRRRAAEGVSSDATGRGRAAGVSAL